MNYLLTTILFLFPMLLQSQKMEIINLQGEKITVIILDEVKTDQYIRKYKGYNNSELRIEWTSRTYTLIDERILVEFYDRKSVLIDSNSDLEKISNVEFVKNDIWNLRKNISYKINVPISRGEELVELEVINKLTKFETSESEYYGYEVYNLKSGQLLYISVINDVAKYTIYPDIKTLASENSSIEDVEYAYDELFIMEKLAKGNPLTDFEPNEHLVYPRYINNIIKSHNLELEESKVFVSEFYGNLYLSSKGYWVLIDEIEQPDATGAKLSILYVRIYRTYDDVTEARKSFKESQGKTDSGEHFYRRISDAYGQNFVNSIDSLIEEIPHILNIDQDQFSIDKDGLKIVDRAIKWNYGDFQLFDRWFPSVLAYYGEYYLKNHENCHWEVVFDKEYKVWIPKIVSADGNQTFDSIDFYRDLCEVPQPLEWAGDFDGSRNKRRMNIKNNFNQKN